MKCRDRALSVEIVVEKTPIRTEQKPLLNRISQNIFTTCAV